MGNEEILNRVINKTTMTINRISPDVKREFWLVAEKEFCDDHGQLIKYLLALKRFVEEGLLPKDVQEIIAAIEAHELRLQAIEKKIELTKTVNSTERTKPIHKLDGTRMNRP